MSTEYWLRRLSDSRGSTHFDFSHHSKTTSRINRIDSICRPAIYEGQRALPMRSNKAPGASFPEDTTPNAHLVETAALPLKQPLCQTLLPLADGEQRGPIHGVQIWGATLQHLHGEPFAQGSRPILLR